MRTIQTPTTGRGCSPARSPARLALKLLLAIIVPTLIAAALLIILPCVTWALRSEGEDL